MQVAVLAVSKLASATADTARILKTVVAEVAVVVVALGTPRADARACLVAVDRDLLGGQVDVVHALAAAAAAAADQVVVVAEGVGSDLFQLGLIGALGRRVGRVLCGRVDTAAVDIVQNGFGLLLGLRGLDADVLEITATAGGSIANRGSSVAGVDDARSAREGLDFGLDRSRGGLGVAAGRSGHKPSRLLLRLRCWLLRGLWQDLRERLLPNRKSERSGWCICRRDGHCSEGWSGQVLCLVIQTLGAENAVEASYRKTQSLKQGLRRSRLDQDNLLVKTVHIAVLAQVMKITIVVAAGHKNLLTL